MSEAERLAVWCDVMAAPPHSASKAQKFQQAAAELRRLAAENERLRKVLTKANNAMHADACYWREVTETTGQTEVTISLSGPLGDRFSAVVAASNELRAAIDEAMKETP